RPRRPGRGGPGTDDPRLPGQRPRPSGAATAGPGTQRGAADMRRRDFLHATGAGFGLALVGPRGLTSVGPPVSRAAPYLLIPMDDSQADHLKAYGLTFRVLERGGRAEWFLNFRGGAFLVPGDGATTRDAALAGVTSEPVSEGQVTDIKAQIQQQNMDAVPLEKPPKTAVYAPPNASPWDDAVTMVLNYAGINFEKVWDAEVVGKGLTKYDW